MQKAYGSRKKIVRTDLNTIRIYKIIDKCYEKDVVTARCKLHFQDEGYTFNQTTPST